MEKRLAVHWFTVPCWLWQPEQYSGRRSSTRTTGRQGAERFSMVPATCPSGSMWQAMQSTPSTRRVARGRTRSPMPVVKISRGAWQSRQSVLA